MDQANTEPENSDAKNEIHQSLDLQKSVTDKNSNSYFESDSSDYDPTIEISTLDPLYLDSTIDASPIEIKDPGLSDKFRTAPPPEEQSSIYEDSLNPVEEDMISRTPQEALLTELHAKLKLPELAKLHSNVKTEALLLPDPETLPSDISNEALLLPTSTDFADELVSQGQSDLILPAPNNRTLVLPNPVKNDRSLPVRSFSEEDTPPNRSLMDPKSEIQQTFEFEPPVSSSSQKSIISTESGSRNQSDGKNEQVVSHSSSNYSIASAASSTSPVEQSPSLENARKSGNFSRRSVAHNQKMSNHHAIVRTASSGSLVEELPNLRNLQKQQQNSTHSESPGEKMIKESPSNYSIVSASSSGSTSNITHKYEYIEAELSKGRNGLGFTLAGGKSTTGGCYVRDIVDDPAKSDGRLQRGDLILSVDGQDISNFEHMDAVNLLRSTGKVVKLTVRRKKKRVCDLYLSYYVLYVRGGLFHFILATNVLDIFIFCRETA